MKVHIIPGGVQVTPLLAYLKRAYPLCPDRALKEALKKRDCRVNGIRSGGDAAVRGGDEVRLYLPDGYLTGPMEILGEGGGLIACLKPAGLPVDRDEWGVGEDTAIARLRAMYPGCALCHRLDAGTGGVLLAARDEAAREKAVEAFRARRVVKRYVCRTVGVPAPPRGVMEDRIARRGSRMVRDPGGLYAALDYRVRFSRNGESVVDVDLHTGRTHQIRVQFAARGWPLLGDDLYGDRTENRLRGARSIRLHCRYMALLGQEFEAPEPEWARMPEEI